MTRMNADGNGSGLGDWGWRGDVQWCALNPYLRPSVSICGFNRLLAQGNIRLIKGALRTTALVPPASCISKSSHLQPAGEQAQHHTHA